jgi:DNA polymerase-1
LRIIAALSGEENMIKAFLNNEDIHKSTASKVFDVPLEEVTRNKHAKRLISELYMESRRSDSAIKPTCHVKRADLIEAYYQSYPRLKSYIQEQIEFARENGYVQTILGRRRYLKDINSQNAMVRGGASEMQSTPIQGSAADIIKAMIINP